MDLYPNLTQLRCWTDFIVTHQKMDKILKPKCIDFKEKKMYVFWYGSGTGKAKDNRKPTIIAIKVGSTYYLLSVIKKIGHGRGSWGVST